MDIASYEREKAEKKLLMKLQEAEEAVKDERAWMSLDELKKSVGVQCMMKSYSSNYHIVIFLFVYNIIIRKIR